MAKLTFVLEDGQEVVVPLKEHITIGRDEDNDIVVDDERISSHHAEIVQNADGSLQIFDLRSTAGTFVNGESQLSCTLLHGDVVAFGPLVGTLDLEHPATAAPIAAEPMATSPAPSPSSPPPSSPPETPAAVIHSEEVAKLQAEKKRLKAEVEAAEKELLGWQQRAEKERALHNARLETLRAEEERLAPAKAAVKQAETAHHDWMEAINALSSQHESKTAALERLNAQHYEKSTEVQRLAATAAEAREEIENLAAQKEEAAARLKQVRDECEQDEAVLNSLRQQIIEHEKRIVEEEARHAALNTSSASLSAKLQRDEAAVKDLETLLMTLEQNAAAAEASLHRVQDELASRHAELAASDSSLAAHNAELVASEAGIAALKAELAAENRRLAEATARRAELEQQNQEIVKLQRDFAAETSRLAAVKAQRAELEQQNQELADTKQLLADARKRLAAVEQRYRDAQVNGAQMAAPKRPAVQEDLPRAAPSPDVGAKAQLGEVNAQLEAARRELADLESKITSLRHVQSASEGAPTEDEPAFPPPVIVQVETIKLPPIKIKSERTRGPAAKKAAAGA